MKMRSLPVTFVTFVVALSAHAQTLRFEEHTIAADLKGGYQVIAYDINHDGKPDLVALASGMTELVWFENPGWQRHVIASNLPHMINCALWDIDGDGIPEIVVAYEFSMDASKSAGIVALLEHQGDPRQPWKVTEIDRLPTSHRLRWANIDGSGKKVVINAPLTDAQARAPEYRGHVPLVYYRPGEWKRHVISDEEEGVVHGIYVTDWDHTGRENFLSAGFTGIHLYALSKGGEWSRTEIAKGDPAPWPKSGSSDVAVGRWNKERFIAAIEPWHGNQVVVYSKSGRSWNRTVIDDSILDGHTILTAGRRLGRGLRRRGSRWRRHARPCMHRLGHAQPEMVPDDEVVETITSPDSRGADTAPGTRKPRGGNPWPAEYRCG